MNLNKMNSMKKIHILLLAVAALFCSCEQPLDVYEGGSGIYFNTDNILLDTLSIPWGMKSSEVKSQELTLRVMLIGDVAPHDRKFNVDVVTEATDTMAAQEGIDYMAFAGEYAIPANEAYTDIRITLLRRPGLKDCKRRFAVVLRETPELQFLYSRQWQQDSLTWRSLDYQRVIVMNENFPRPRWWSLDGQSRFGNFSQTKAALICDVMGIDREAWVNAIIGDGKFTMGYLSYVGRYMHRWLQENPTLDENGSPMTMGPDSRN